MAAGFLLVVVADDLTIEVGLALSAADSGGGVVKSSYHGDGVLSGTVLGVGLGEGPVWLRVPIVGVELSSQPTLPSTQLWPLWQADRSIVKTGD